MKLITAAIVLLFSATAFAVDTIPTNAKSCVFSIRTGGAGINYSCDGKASQPLAYVADGFPNEQEVSGQIAKFINAGLRLSSCQAAPGNYICVFTQ